jgi:hypothetical protein
MAKRREIFRKVSRLALRIKRLNHQRATVALAMTDSREGEDEKRGDEN